MKAFIIIVIIIIVAVGAWLLLSNKQPDNTDQSTNTSTDQSAQEQTSGSDEVMVEEFSPVTTGDIVVLETDFGNIKIKLNREAAPITSDNFAKLAQDGFYDGLTFHRILPGFVVQGGDPEGTGRGGPGYTLPAEINLLHTRGAIAMARLPDEVNPKRESSGSQFYFALRDLSELDGQYTVFGNVIEGFGVVDEIAAVATNNPVEGRPLEDVVIKRAYLEQTK